MKKASLPYSEIIVLVLLVVFIIMIYIVITGRLNLAK